LKNLIIRINNKVRKIHTNIAYRTILNIKPDVPIVSFTFDDFPLSAYRLGGRILKKFGALGTFYISMRFADGETENGPGFRRSDLTELVQEGHEIGCHTYEHLDAAKKRGKDFADSIKKNYESICDILGPALKLNSFAYPYGRNNPEVKKVVSAAFQTARSTSHGINYGSTDIKTLKACSIYGVNDNDNHLRDIIHLNNQRKGFLIFYTHDIQEHPTQFGCTEELFEKVVSMVKESGAKILPITKALEACKQAAFQTTLSSIPV
jgi:peptidoglycan/xylan/chitin deacetylase (PgdA/CDA1 family)